MDDGIDKVQNTEGRLKIMRFGSAQKSLANECSAIMSSVCMVAAEIKVMA